MAIIKSQSARTLLKDALVLDLGDVARQAQRLREAAEQKAHSVIEDAHRQAEQLSRRVYTDSAQKGHEEGFAQGLSQGRAQGLKDGRQEALDLASQELGQLQKAWTDAIGQWENQRQDMQRDARRAVLDFALQLAQKLVHRVIQVDRAVAVDQIAAVLSHVLRPADVTIHICKDDRPAIEEAMPRLLAEFSQVKHVHLVDDPSVSQGGCVVSYGQGKIDATIETQMQRLVELMT